MRNSIALTLVLLFSVSYAYSQCTGFFADFSHSGPKCEGEAVDFVNTGSSGPGLVYAWSFGAGATPGNSAMENPTGVVYGSPGLKSVTLTITDPNLGCVASATKGVTINDEPTVSFTSNAPICEDADANFTNTGSSGVAWTYSWDFGAGASPPGSSAENPTGVSYTTPGTKTITFTISDANCSATQVSSITVNPTPVADFSSTAPQCTGSDVDFTNTGSAGSYVWSFGAGATPPTSTMMNPSGVVYSTAGTKTVQLITTAGSCSDTSTQTISINLTPTVSFTSTAPQCAEAPVDFTNTGTSGLGWNFDWDFGANASPAIASSENPTGVSYNDDGSKTVTLTISDANCASTTTSTITINAKPVADFASTAPQCTGDAVDFTNTGSAGTYAWDFGSGATPATAATANPAGVAYSTEGTKTVTLITTIGTCTDTSIQTLNINLTPAVSFTSTAPQCAEAPVDFTNTGATGGTWNYDWDFGADALPGGATAENPVGVIYNGGGSKTVTLTISDANCSAATTNTITVNEKPVADFSTDAPKCTGDTVAFLNTGTTGATYTWDLGSGATPATSTDESPSGVIYFTQGTKTITLITTLGLCSDTSVQTINIGLTPTVGFTSTAPQCAEASVDFTNTGTNGLGWSFAWDLGDDAQPATSTAENPAGVRYTQGGDQVVTLVISNANCAATAIDTITIEEKPVASFAVDAPQCTGDTVAFTNTGTTGATYEWDLGADATPATSTDENPSGVIYSTAGTKVVTLITTLGSCTDTTVQTFTIHLTPAVSFTSTAPQCAGVEVDFTNTGDTGPNWSYFWDLGAGAVPEIATAENPEDVVYEFGGTKTVTLTISDNFCTNTDSATINIDALPVADAGADTTICANRCTEIGSAAIAGNTYAWFPTATLSDGSIANPVSCPTAAINEYFVTVTGSNGCVKVDSITVTMLPPVVADAGIDVEICFGDSVQIGAALVEGQTYTWAPADGLSDATLPSPIAQPDTTTLYTISASFEGCEVVTDEVLVTVNPLPPARATDDLGRDSLAIARGDVVQLIGTGGVQYVWTPETWLNNPGIFNPLATPDSSIVYTVTVTDLNFCVNSDSVIITVLEPAIFIPSAFTPNNDGHNDVFYVRNIGLTKFEFQVFDRLGNLIFRTTDSGTGWDGINGSSSKRMPEGAYVYFVKGELSDGVQFTERGIVNLIR